MINKGYVKTDNDDFQRLATLSVLAKENSFKTGNYDQDFLLKLDKQKNKTIYARIIALSQEEKPLEVLEGRVTGGSINIDGASAVRRTCSLTLVGEDLRFTDYLWAFKQKFKLQIGVENTIDANYPNVIWFEQGIYLVSTFSHNETLNSMQVSIQGKDKMAKLDGSMGGIVTAETNFGVYDSISADGTITTTPIPIYQIIQNMIHQLAGEPFHNIVISDLEEFGYELWDYRGEADTSIYYFYKKDTNEVVNISFDGNKKVYKEGTQKLLKELDESDLYNRNDLATNGTLFTLSDTGINEYRVAKIEYGETAGYHRTELTYNGELIARAGETLVSILDKIKNMLGEYEYFYDLMGRFIFQKKKTYIQNLFSPLKDGYVEAFVAMDKYSYKFEDKEMIISCSDNPSLGEVKNDFTIWGTNSSNNPIHARFAIDHRPIQYQTLPHYERIYLTYFKNTEEKNGFKYVKTQNGYDLSSNQNIGVAKVKDSLKGEEDSIYQEIGDSVIEILEKDRPQLYVLNDSHEFVEVNWPSEDIVENYYIKTEDSKTYSFGEVDWRELIYLMARDYYQHNENPRYELMLKEKNPWCKNGKTGFEHYYADLQGFWRLLYHPNPIDEAIEVWPKDKEALKETSYFKLKPILKEDSLNPSFDEEKENTYAVVIRTRKIKVDNTIKEKKFYCLKPLKALAAKDKTYGDYYYQLYFTTELQAEYQAMGEEFKNGNGDIIQPILENNLTINIIKMEENEEKISSEPIKIFEKGSEYILDNEDKFYRWSKTAVYSPQSLLFWFDFLDTYGELESFSVPSAGVRPKVDNNKSVKTIYNKEIPEIEFVIMPQEFMMLNTNGPLALQQMRLQADFEPLFNISSSGLSAVARAEELINKHACMNSSISLTTIPIYYLEPNTRIYVKNENLQIDGDYLVSKITIPLTHNGTMNINATKIINQIN